MLIVAHQSTITSPKKGEKHKCWTVLAQDACRRFARFYARALALRYYVAMDKKITSTIFFVAGGGVGEYLLYHFYLFFLHTPSIFPNISAWLL